MDESEEALSSICEEDVFPKGESWAESRVSQSLDVDAKEEPSDEGDSRKERDEDDIQEGTIEEVDSKEDKYEDTVTESRNKEDSSEEKDKDDVLQMQKIGNEVMGSVEYRVGTVAQKDAQKNWDFRDNMVDVVGEELSSDELDSREVKYESVVMGISTEYSSEVNRQQKEYFQDREEDGSGMDHSPEYSSDVVRKQKEYSQEQEEDMENAQSGKGSYLTDEEEENDGSRRKHEELYHGLCSLQADRQEDGEKTDAIECNEEEIYEDEQETLLATGTRNTGFSKGWSPLEIEHACNSVFQGLLAPDFEDDMKEFSEDDLGVIGEDFAEYPSECFQQKDKEEIMKKVEDVQIESMWMTPKLEMEGTAQVRGEIFEWEILDRHTEIHDECSVSEEAARDIPDEEQSAVLKNSRDGPENMFLEKKDTEQQDSEGDRLRKKDQGMEENRPVKDEMAEGVQELMGLTYSSAWKKIDKGDLADSEPQEDTMIFDVTHGDFLDVQDESGTVSWAEDPLITETRNSQEIFEKVCLAETENQDRDLKAEEISLVTESVEEKLTYITDAQQQKSQNYNEEEDYEQDTERSEAFYQYENDDQDCHTRQSE